MSKWISLILTLFLFALFTLGCGVSKDAKVKCPRCGAIFVVDEAIEEYHMKK